MELQVGEVYHEIYFAPRVVTFLTNMSSHVSLMQGRAGRTRLVFCRMAKPDKLQLHAIVQSSVSIAILNM